MSKKLQLLNAYLRSQDLALQSLKLKGIHFLESEDIWTILITEFDLGLEYSQILFMELTPEEITELVFQSVKKNGEHLGRIELENEDDPVDWLKTADLAIFKAIVKYKNEKWEIHQHDVDPFPSSPHAHNYAEGTKLDLKNGDIYNKTKKVGKMKAKEFAQLRNLIKRDFPKITLPAKN